jgi:hypothetical protein
MQAEFCPRSSPLSPSGKKAPAKIGRYHGTPLRFHSQLIFLRRASHSRAGKNATQLRRNFIYLCTKKANARKISLQSNKKIVGRLILDAVLSRQVEPQTSVGDVHPGINSPKNIGQADIQRRSS